MEKKPTGNRKGVGKDLNTDGCHSVIYYGIKVMDNHCK